MEKAVRCKECGTEIFIAEKDCITCERFEKLEQVKAIRKTDRKEDSKNLVLLDVTVFR